MLVVLPSPSQKAKRSFAHSRCAEIEAAGTRAIGVVSIVAYGTHENVLPTRDAGIVEPPLRTTTGVVAPGNRDLMPSMGAILAQARDQRAGQLGLAMVAAHR